jgi:lysophospholipase L1-like esterase
MEDTKKMSVFLAGDSIVKTYEPEEFTGGWGQYLHLFLDGRRVKMNNFAKGGRSSRSFINEGLLGEISSRIKEGDYLFIEFCHNDDETKSFDTMYNRMTPLGRADGNGNYPSIPGEFVPSNYIPSEYLSALASSSRYVDRETLVTAYDTIASYGDFYYPYSRNGMLGSFKWFLKQYIKVARKVGAIPVLVAAPPRATFSTMHKLADGPGLHGGDNYSYIRAVRQLAKEEDVLLIDLFTEFKNIFENLGKGPAHYLTAIKTGMLSGEWPEDYNKAKENPAVVCEDTHFNKFGAYLLTAKLVEIMVKQIDSKTKANHGKESFDALKPYIFDKPHRKVPHPSGLDSSINIIKRHFQYSVF